METFTDGVMVWVRVHYQDPDGDTAGFGFHGAKGSGWAEETHPFSSPSYGRAIPAGIEYPFNHECGRPNQYESDIEFWVYDATGLRSESVVVHLACSTPPVPQPVGTPTQPPLAASNYAALGDSYSSGEGLGSYTDTSKCDRSSLAYGPLLKLDLGKGFVACSGAVTADISHPNHNNQEPEQIKALSTSTNVVTLTIGGDDIGFVQVLKSCVKADNDSALNTDCQSKPPSGSTDQKTTLAQAVNARMRALSGGGSDTTPDGIKIDPISTVIKNIHDKAPKAHIYIAGYPILFSRDESRYHSVTGKKYKVGDLGGVPIIQGWQATIRYSDAKWIDDEIVKGNTLIKNAANTVSGVTYVDAAAKFNGHAVNDQDPWINGFVPDAAHNAAPKSFHPTDVGQSSGYKDAFQAKIHPLLA